jgi:catechol 1,2-dioxygenase
MNRFSRRDLLRQGVFGLAAGGAGGLVLRADAQVTPASGTLGSYGAFLAQNDKAPLKLPAKWQPTEDNILGPYYRPGAPFRAKVTPPLEPGDVLLVSGRVWAFDTKKPLANAVLDIWQANAQGRYDNDDPRNPPAKDVFLNRARLITDENGYYEYETIHPGPYQIGENQWRPCHIHYLVRAAGYQSLVTQLYFRGDKFNKTDEFIKESLIIDVRKEKARGAAYEMGTFDIVLAPAPKK